MALSWENMGPGLLSAAGGYLTSEQKRKEEEARAREVRGAQEPYSSAALNQLLQAQQFSTTGNAAERYKQQMALMEPDFKKAQLSKLREMHRLGQLGVSTNEPTAGLAEGTGHNPMMSSLLGAQETARQQAAARALDDSQRTLDAMVRRTQDLNYGARTAGDNRRNAMPTTSKTSFLGSFASLLGNKDISGALAKGISGIFGDRQPQATAAQSASANGQWDQPGSFSVSQPSWSDDDWNYGYTDTGLFGNDVRWDDYNLGDGWGY